MKFEHHHLEVERDGDYVILRQNESGGTEAVCLHVSQLRYVAEMAGVVQPNYPADELTKRLAHQLCEIRRELADECYRSHWLGMTWEKLHGYCESIPDNVFPWEMFEDEADQAPPATAPEKPTAKPSPTPTAKPSFELTHPA
jgi:hypothetical protein